VEDVTLHRGDLWSRNLSTIGSGATTLGLLAFWLIYFSATRIGRRHHRPTPPPGPPTPAPELVRAG
jgi:hypothetical protein